MFKKDSSTTIYHSYQIWPYWLKKFEIQWYDSVRVLIRQFEFNRRISGLITYFYIKKWQTVNLWEFVRRDYKPWWIFQSIFFWDYKAWWIFQSIYFQDYLNQLYDGWEFMSNGYIDAIQFFTINLWIWLHFFYFNMICNILGHPCWDMLRQRTLLFSLRNIL